ncbi:MAG: hypothetical protein K0S04_882 [Herbinix sp.]|jgi:hypothetical protein|nr:hypothetical protein [Herbinix sp.]
MSENKNYNGNISFDEWNIKSHLNDSLDLSGISVSEDLINRTLLAIKQSEIQAVSEVEESQTENDAIRQTTGTNLGQTGYTKDEPASNKKVIQWNRYIRAFAGVAAAVVVVAAGYGLASNGAFSGNKTATESKDMAYDTTATKEAADENTEAEISNELTMSQTEESTSNALAPSGDAGTVGSSANSNYGEATTDGIQDPSVSENAGIMGGAAEGTTGIENPQYSIVADVPTIKSKTDSEDAGGSAGSGSNSTGAGTDSSALQSREPSMKKSSAGLEVTLSFLDIFLADPAKASSLTITDELNNITVVLTKKEDIQSFYTMMEQYQFTYADQAGNNSNYVIEIATPIPSMTRYTMYVGDSIVIDYADDVTTSHSVYTTASLTELSSALQEFCQKHSK